MQPSDVINNAKIMIIDDSMLNIKILTEVLEHFGACIRGFLDGRKALAEIEQFVPDMVLLDITMPYMDGFEVCHQIKSLRQFQDTPVIFISSLSEIRDKAQAFEAGAVDYITKPFDVREVELRVYTHLKILRLQQHVSAYNQHLEQLVQEQYSQILKEKESLAQAQIAMIMALARLADCRDSETGEHLDRMKFYCQCFSKALANYPDYKEQMQEEVIISIMHASALHDIGKVGIPDKILRKDGALEEEEFAVMKTHTLIGAETIGEIVKQYPENRFLITAMEMALSHHECWDGSGYPFGISGKRIPLSARILAICDVYDALRAKRVYKKAFSHKEACQIIIHQSGKQFDPFFVEVFIEQNRNFSDIYEQSLG